MHRFTHFFFIFIVILYAFSLCGCGASKPKEVSVEMLTNYLEKKYNDTFTLKDSKESSLHKGTDTLYTFESGSGITCHISKVYSGGFLGYTYSYSEDYPVMYLRKYPELMKELSEGAFEMERIDIDDNACFESKYILYFNSYEEIEAVLYAIDIFLERAKAIPDSSYVIPDKKITQKCPNITIGIKGKDYHFEVYYHYPTKHNSNKKQKEDFLEDVQDNYVMLVRKGELSDTLSPELLNKHPAPAINNITLHDKKVIDSMVYRKQIGEYCIDQSCNEYMGCKFYPDKLDTFLKALGWSVKISERSIVYSKGEDKVELCLKGYGINNTQLHCFKNGEEYTVCGQLLWQSGTNPIITLSESDLNYLFGIGFEFDQINLTGKVIPDNS